MEETKVFSPRELLAAYPSREAKIARIRVIERRLEKMESEDEHNDPKLIAGHIRLTRGYRMGCGVFILCLALMCWRIAAEGSRAASLFFWVLALGGGAMILRGLLYVPDPKIIEAAYTPHRGSEEYKGLIDEMDTLARALSQGLRAEDEG